MQSFCEEVLVRYTSFASECVAHESVGRLVLLVFKEIDLEARAPDASDDGKWIPVPLVQRTDPLTLKTSRILTGVKLQPESAPSLDELTSGGGFCPFCDGTIEKVTFPFERDVVKQGRLRRNRAAIVPNIMAYSSYSSVTLYDTSTHFLGLREFSRDVLFDAFSLTLEYARALRHVRPQLTWSSLSANYLPSSGSSVVHPHMQSSHDLVPMQVQRDFSQAARRYYADNSTSYFIDLVESERRGPRFISDDASLTWLTPFAPRGFQEIWGVIKGANDLVTLSDETLASLAKGMETIFRYYDANNFSAFNFSLIDGGPEGSDFGFGSLFRILVRSNPDPYYRSDVTYFERLLDEPLIDVSPEEVAAGVKAFFED